MELMLHSMYVVAMKDAHAWAGDTPFELSMIGLWNLYIVWLKVCFLNFHVPVRISELIGTNVPVASTLAFLPTMGSCGRN